MYFVKYKGKYKNKRSRSTIRNKREDIKTKEVEVHKNKRGKNTPRNKRDDIKIKKQKYFQKKKEMI